MGAAALLMLSGCGSAEDPQPDPPAAETQDADQTAENGQSSAPENTAPQNTGEPDEDSSTFTIAAVGDVLIHDAIIDAAETQDGYDFTPLLAGVQEWISGADLALCGLEVPIAPEGTQPVGYPVFAAPEETAAALAETGFHGCSTANNHSLDQGVAGLQRTLEVFDEQGLGHAGTARTEAEAQRPQMYRVERDDTEVTVAHLATTSIHNGAAQLPAEMPWALTDVSAEELTEQAAAAREAGADIVVASVHWGQEYVHQPTAAQRAYGEQLAAGGEIDLVVGGHSHTPQPLEQLEGGPSGDGMWTLWSMGNFFTNQDDECCIPQSATGLMAFATVEADGEEPARITDVEWSPSTVDRQGASRGNEDFYGIWSLAGLMDQIPEEVRTLDEATVEARWDRVLEVVGEDRLRLDPPESTGEDAEVIPRSE